MRGWFAITVFAVAAGCIPALSVKCSGQEQQQIENKRKVMNRVAPAYPELAKKMNVIGAVRVVAVVAPNGRVLRTEVVGGSPVLLKAAEDAISKWKWAASPEETKELVEIRFKTDQ
jgi:TonB family protein